jgi:signal transduction histidine kinase
MDPRREQGTTEIRGVTRNTREASNRFADEDLRIQNQELRELNRELEVRLAARTAQVEFLSHEFRTPLQAIVGYTELLEQEIHGPINEAQRRDLDRIRQCQEHLLGLLTASLDLSQLENRASTATRP